MSGVVGLADPGQHPLAGQVIVVTGATSGIGEVAASRLAGRGARLVLVARDGARAQALLARLPAPAAGGRHEVHLADLSLLAGQRAAVAAIRAQEPRLDALVNNAGAVFMGAPRTADGLSPSFALNHLAFHVLALGLLPTLRPVPGARIVNTASRAHRYAPRLPPAYTLEHLQRDGIRGYALSKLCNLWFTRELARRLGPGGVTVHALHPGFVATRFADSTPWPWNALMRWRKRVHGRTPELGAATLVALAAGGLGAGGTGGYWFDGQPAAASPAAVDAAAAARLWELTAALCGLDLPAPAAS